MTSIEIKKLNAYQELRTIAEINNVISFLEDGVFPAGLNARQRARFVQKFGNGDWVVHVNRLFYRPQSVDGVARISLCAIPNIAIIRNQVLSLIYNDMHRGLGLGLNQFYHQVCMHYIGITRKQTSEFLKRQGDYQISRPIHKTVNYPILARCANELWQVDCIVLHKYAVRGYNNNGHHSRILTVVDVFSKMVWCRPLINETAVTVAAGINDIFNQTRTYPHRLQTDNAPSFTGAAFRDLLAEHNIIHKVSTSYSPNQNAHVERMNQEVRKKIRAGIVLNNNIEWSQFLNDYCTNINNQKTSSRNFTPRELWTPGYHPAGGRPNHHLQINDHSSIANIRGKVRANQISRASNMLARERANVFAVGDHVRVKIAAIDSDMRKRIKASNDNKYTSISYTPQVLQIRSVIHNHNPALPLGVGNNAIIRNQYTLQTLGDRVLIERNGIPIRFFGSDLMHVPIGSTPAHVENFDRAALLNRF